MAVEIISKILNKVDPTLWIISYSWPHSPLKGLGNFVCSCSKSNQTFKMWNITSWGEELSALTLGDHTGNI